jgi:serine/threonine-protein kinase
MTFVYQPVRLSAVGQRDRANPGLSRNARSGTSMRPQVGQVINNKYRLVRLIGDGGMGSVYEARHEVLGTTVALKFLHPELSRRQGLVQRFLQEARVSAQIQSPHVVRVSDVDQSTTGLAFIVMEYLEGRTLQTLYEDLYRAGQRLSYDDALDYSLQILEGVEAAHRTGVVHRDLKPDNVMIVEDARKKPLIKLLDFGIAKLKVTGELDRGLTRPGVIMGTPEYMAPEQAFSADAVDSRADIFSLGVIIFEMLAGRRPVGGDEATVIASQYIQGQVAQLRDLAPNVPASLAAAIHKAIAPMAKDRLATVAELRAAIEGARGGTGAGAHASTAPVGAAAAPGVAAASPAPSAVPRTNAPAEEIAAHGAVAAAGGYAHASLAEPPPAHGTALDARPPSALDMHVQNGGAPYPVIPEAVIPEATAEYVPPPQRPGGTDVGAADAFVPEFMGASHTAAAANAQALPGTAPMDPYAAPAYQPVVSLPHTAPRPARGGGGAFVLILLLAASISGLVVAGLWVAHRFAQRDEATDEQPQPAPTPTTPPVPTVAEPPPTTPTTPVVATPPIVKPPVTTPTTPAKPPTSTKPPTTPPPATSTKPPGVIIPGPLPTFFPGIPMPTLPGLGGGTTPPPSTGSGTPPPSTGSGTPPPATSSTGRPQIKIPVPRPK